MSDIDIVVVNYKTYGIVQKFIDSYYKFLPTTPSRLIIVDNESDLDKIRFLDTYDAHVLPFSENLGYAKACNFGASVGNSKYIALMNSDTEFVDAECVDKCVQYLDDHPNVGVVGPLQYADTPRGKKVTHAGIFGPGSKPHMRAWQQPMSNDYRDTCEALMISGSAMFIRREAWDAIASDPTFRKHWPSAKGAMPEHSLYYEDTALCYAMPHFGYKVVYLGAAEMIHQWHKTIEKTGEGTHFHDSRAKFRSLMDDWGIEHD